MSTGIALVAPDILNIIKDCQVVKAGSDTFSICGVGPLPQPQVHYQPWTG